MSHKNIAASVRARLLNKARASQQDFNLVLTRFALERLLYRLSVSNYADQFMLKGALLFDLWFDIHHRPTRDADFLGFGSADIPRMRSVFQEICAIEVNDGIVYQRETVSAQAIRKETNYPGIRVTFLGILDGARCAVQADIGFGDAVTPGPEQVDYLVLLSDLPQPALRVYPRYTVVAEKLEALVSLGIANSRMKDYFDLWILAKYTGLDGAILCQAIKATFERRSTPLPTGIPFGLTDEFANDQNKQIQWQAFLKKNALSHHVTLEETVAYLRTVFVIPFLTLQQN